MSDTVQSLRDLILNLVPADGSTIGDQALIGKLRNHLPDLDDAEYHEAKDALVAEDLLARGRGGSVWRTDGHAPAGNGSAAYAHLGNHQNSQNHVS